MGKLDRQVARNQQKAAKKAVQSLPDTLKQLVALEPQLTEMSRALPIFGSHLNQLRNITADLYDGQEMHRYEGMRQRAVALRFEAVRRFPFLGPDFSMMTPDTIGKYLTDAEEQFRCEYDAIVALARLSAWVTPAQTEVPAEAPEAPAPVELAPTGT